MKPKKNDKVKASSKPEYLFQQQAENHLNQSYNKLLLALNINLLADINQNIQEPENS